MTESTVPRRLAEGRSYRPHRSCEVPFSPLRQTNRIPRTDFNDFSEMRALLHVMCQEYWDLVRIV